MGIETVSRMYLNKQELALMGDLVSAEGDRLAKLLGDLPEDTPEDDPAAVMMDERLQTLTALLQKLNESAADTISLMNAAERQRRGRGDMAQ